MDDEAVRSAPPVVELLTSLMNVTSAVDVGCGTGAWLAELMAQGVDDVAGLDQEQLPADLLRIPAAHFTTVDLTSPPDLGRRFDLAICVEVAEHLGPERADDFVRYLCSLAPVVCFSAAIPGQGGVGHLNEQWPDYWAARFEAHGFDCLDALRPRLWNDDRVAPYYRQNLLLFYDADSPSTPERTVTAALPPSPLPLVHPGTLEVVREQAAARAVRPLALRALLRRLPAATTEAVQRRIDRRRARRHAVKANADSGA